ncbi:MAG: NAD(P)-dependent oxidoreductase [Muribaculaceae bacterium]|nr:NAD(P)-dependent oxidoreductase [Muribaculaceae bacterium]
MKILLTGASGMLGGYLLPLLKEGNEVKTLQRHDADFICDLTADMPDFGDNTFDLVVHAAGSADDGTALDLNLEGTRRLLSGLEKNPPKEFVYVSSWEVYSPDSGEGVKEDHQLWASTKVGQSKARAEEIVRKWCADHDVLLTVVRPARMFGKGVKGEMRTLFNDVVNSRYIHVRDNDAKLSLVCASDVAEAIEKLHSIGGTFNISDGKDAKWIELAEAMSSNSGAMKRQTFLPKKWADVAWKLASWIPAVKASLSPDVLSRRSKTLTLSSEALKIAFPGWNPYPTIDVIGRVNKDYPYQDR